MNINDIEEQAKAEIETEDHRAQVEAAKARIRERRARSIWKKLFPFKIVRI